MVLGRKTIFFPGKTKQNQKKHLLRHYAARHQKDGFLVFPRKKMVLHRKTNFFLGKRWLWTGKPEKNCSGQENQLFPRENPKKKQKKHFWRHYAARHQKDGFSRQNHLFPRKKLVFHAQTIFSLGKSWFSCPKPFFSSGKPSFWCLAA